MDDLIGRLVARAGVDRTAAQKAVGVIVQLPSNAGRPERVRARIRRLPGDDATMPASSSSVRSPRMFGAISDAMGQIHAAASETLKFAREKAREDAVGKVVGATPGLGRFV
jgi:hypothetical protein